MTKRPWLTTLGAGALLAAGVIAVPVADAIALDDAAEGADVTITGDALERASAAALAYLGEGRVTETEVGDEEGAYEVEVTLADGRQLDVHLDENFQILGEEAEGAEDGDDD